MTAASRYLKLAVGCTVPSQLDLRGGRPLPRPSSRVERAEEAAVTEAKGPAWPFVTERSALSLLPTRS